MKKLLLFFVMTLLPVLGNAQTLIDGIYYNLNSSDKTASVTNNSNAYYSGRIVIPEQVLYEGVTYSVTSIGDNAFNNCTNLTNVSISNSITSIGKGAFSKTGLKTLIVGAGVQLFDKSAFSGAAQPIKTIWLTNTPPQNYSVAQGIVNYVANSQYGSLNNRIEYKYLSSLFNVDGVTYVPVSPSERTCDAIDCVCDESLTEVHINPTVSYSGISMKVLKIQPYISYQNNNLQNLYLDIDCNIDKYSFYGCKNLRNVELGRNITEINEYAFSKCSLLESIKIPDSVKIIEQYAFDGCSNLASAVMGNGVESIGQYAFSNCSNLTSVVIGEGTKTIDSYCFKDCTSLLSVTLGNRLVTIGQYAFQNCSLLPSIIIPKSVIFINHCAFSGCQSLKEVIMLDRDSHIETTSYDDSTLKQDSYFSIGVQTGGVLTFDYSISYQAKVSVFAEGVLSQQLSGSGTFRYYFDKTVNVQVYISYYNSSYGSPYCKITNWKIIKGGPLFLDSNGNNPLFADCPLDSVYIGRNISYEKAYYSPFYRNTSLRSVVITDLEEEISSSEFFGCTNLNNVKIGDGVSSIGSRSFSGCSSLNSFSFGSNVNSIGAEAFSDCTALTHLESRAGTPPTCGSQALDDINKWTCKLIVPQGYLEAYQSADQWKEFFFIEEGEPIPVPITGLSLNKRNTSFYISESDTLTVIYTPENTSVREIKWSSSDESIATVDNNGVVTGKKGGVANIIVRSVSNPDIFASCTVTVRWPSITLNKTSTAFPLGYRDSLIVFFTPESTINKEVEWSSSDETIAVVDENGVVTGKAKGTVTITIKYVLNPEITASCEVTVQGPNIIFADTVVKAICVERWDVNGDGELNESEAEVVKDLGTAFKSSNIQTFEELKYFTGLSNLSDDAFRECSSLTKISLPDNLKRIGNYAFRGCSALTSIIIPPNVTSLGNYAFSFCDGIKSFTIPNSVTYIGEYAFAYSSTLSALELPENLTTINNYLFYYCTSLKDIKIPQSVTSIGYQSFLNCKSLTTITIPQNVTYIGGNAFVGCDKLKTVVSLNETPPTIARYAFNSGELDYADYPGAYLLVPKGSKEKYQNYDTNETIYKRWGQYAFSKIIEFEPEIGEFLVLRSYSGGKIIYEGQEISGSASVYAVEKGKNISVKIVPNEGYELSTCTIDGDTITDLTRDSENTFSYTLIADKGHRINTIFTKTIIEGSELLVDGILYRVLANNELEVRLRYTFDGIPIYYSGDVVIPDSVVLPVSLSQPQRVYKVTSINKYAFKNDNGQNSDRLPLKSVVIGNNITKIDEGTFQNCRNLIAVTLGTKINSIGDWAFSNCVSLTVIKIINTIPPSIGSSAFSSYSPTLLVHRGCKEAYMNADIWKNFENIEEFDSDSEFAQLTIKVSGEGTVEYGSLCLKNDTRTILKEKGSEMTLLLRAESNSEIGDVLVDGISHQELFNEKITEYAYTFNADKDCTIEVQFVKSIVDGSTFACNGIMYYRLSPEEVEVTSNRDNGGYHGDIVIPESIKYKNSIYRVIGIGNLAFRNMAKTPNKPTSVVIPNSVIYIGENAFANCKTLSSITLGNNVTEIRSSAFKGCSGLTTVALPESVTSIGSGVFLGCTGLVDPICNSRLFARLPTSHQGGFAIPQSIETICSNAFSSCSGLTSISIPESVTRIEDEAFSSCSGLTSLIIHKNILSIGKTIFSGCTNLSSIIVEAENKTYDSRDNCNAIIETGTNTLIEGCKATVIPNSIRSIGDGAFQLCTDLLSIIIPESVVSIGANAFNACGLTSVTIPNSVTSIGDYAFSYCTGLTSLTIPKGITTIARYAFSGCQGLTSIEIPEGVTRIGEYSFAYCSGLSSIIIPKTVNIINNYAFFTCPLTSVTVYNPIPATIMDNSFSSQSTATLYVPTGSKEAYQAANFWKDFMNILEIEDYDGILPISLEKANNTSIYDLNGKRLMKPSKGINIIGGKKVVVK